MYQRKKEYHGLLYLLLQQYVALPLHPSKQIIYNANDPWATLLACKGVSIKTDNCQNVDEEKKSLCLNHGRNKLLAKLLPVEMTLSIKRSAKAIAKIHVHKIACPIALWVLKAYEPALLN